MKYYAVRKGNKTGIFENWTDCQDATKGFSGPEFKSFSTREEAEAYLEDKDIWKEKVSEDNRNGYLVAFTDGSFDEALKRYSYGVVIVCPDGNKENICGYGSNEKYVDSNNIIGEIFGVINALDWSISNGYEKIKIYHDYQGLSKWLSGEWKANVPASQMFVHMYQQKYEGLLNVSFEWVHGHSNVSFNEEADALAKCALQDRKRIAVSGANWYSVSGITKVEFDKIVDSVTNSDINIRCKSDDYTDKCIYKFSYGNENVTATIFKSVNQKLLVQGKNNYLFHVIATYIVESDENSKVEQILGSTYRVSIKNEVINEASSSIESGLPTDYPTNIKRLIRQAIINLRYSTEAEDYSQYAFPALRALEGHIKYLIVKAGGNVGRLFSSFNKNSPTDPYYYSGTLADVSKKSEIETCYNYYKSERDTTFHYGDMLGMTDNTRIMETKEKADEIINKCLSLINENP